jgi:hypothetical protein
LRAESLLPSIRPINSCADRAYDDNHLFSIAFDGAPMSAIWTEVPSVELDLAKPPSRRFDSMPQAIADRGKLVLDALAPHLPPSYRRIAMAAALRTMNLFTGEAKGLAARVGTDWHRVFVANLSYDLVLSSLGCSTAALATPQGPVLARNMDWAPEGPLARASVRIDAVRKGELVHRTANWPGGIGVVTGLSSRGFAVALNAVFHPDGLDLLGYPVLYFLRRVLDEARDFDEALHRLQTQRLMIAGLFTLVGTQNSQRVAIERSPRQAALRWADNNRPLLTTNHYQAMSVPRGPLAFGLSGTSADRCASLADLVSSMGETIADEALLFALTDERVIQSITAQHVIARPASNTLRVFVPTRLLGM